MANEDTLWDVGPRRCVPCGMGQMLLPSSVPGAPSRSRCSRRVVRWRAVRHGYRGYDTGRFLRDLGDAGHGVRVLRVFQDVHAPMKEGPSGFVRLIRRRVSFGLGACCWEFGWVVCSVLVGGGLVWLVFVDWLLSAA